MQRICKYLQRFSRVALIFALTLSSTVGSFPGLAQAETAPQSIQTQSARTILHRLAEGVSRITLSNGLKVLVFRRKQAPVFNGQIWVKVGGVNEVPGITGVAHMLEHMAFKGSTTIGTSDYEKEQPLLVRYEELMRRLEADAEDSDAAKELESVRTSLEKLWLSNEFATVYQNRGAVGLNAATSKDYTYYTVSLPVSSFELWCWMESDRLLNPVFRQFYKERDVVLEERRMRTEDSPAGRMYEALLATAYWAHPNRLPVIGWRSDVEQLRTQDVKDFWDIYYRPDNMVIGLVGDLDPEQIRPTLERYFGRLKKPERELPVITVKEPKQTGERRTQIEFDAEPEVVLAFHKPVYPDKDDLHFAVLHSVLSDGRSSILERELVREKQLAASVDSSEAPGELFPSLFYVWGIPAQGVSSEKFLQEVQAVLERLKSTPISAADLEAAKKRVRVDLLGTLASNSGLAQSLAHAELLWGNWEVLFEMYDTILATTAEDVQRLAQKYFNIENRTVLFLNRKAK